MQKQRDGDSDRCQGVRGQGSDDPFYPKQNNSTITETTVKVAFSFDLFLVSFSEVFD